MADPLPDPYTLGGCVYYAQNREDLVLLSFFSDIKKGMYVDVGAFDPDYDSVTKLFYLQGWRGINIEPQIDRYKKFVKRRPDDINLNIGISDKTSELKLRAYTSGGLSTFSDELKKEYEQNPDSDTAEFTDITLPVRPLRDVLAEQKVGHINFLKIDVEGLEYEVLSSNDWEQFRPEVICIEANHIKHDWRPVLDHADYELVYNDGLNDYYADSKTDRKAKFNLVEDLIHDRGGGIRVDHYDLMLKLHTLAKDKSNHVEQLLVEKEKLLKEIADLKTRLQKYRSIRYTTSQLMGLLRNKVQSMVESKK